MHNFYQEIFPKEINLITKVLFPPVTKEGERSSGGIVLKSEPQTCAHSSHLWHSWGHQTTPNDKEDWLEAAQTATIKAISKWISHKNTVLSSR